MGRWQKSFSILLLFLFVVANVFAAPGRTTYQARIVKPNGYPLEANNVNFQFSILDPTGTCVIYVETYSAVNMANSGGLISFSLGSGTRSYPASSTAIETVFDNSTASYSCQAPGIYNPVASDIRKIVMQFNDGAGWQTLPAMSINAVPYAMYANNATLFNGKADTAFAQLSTIPTCTASQALHFNGATFSCVTAGSVGTSYTVTSSDVTSALGYTPANQSSVATSFTTVTSTISNFGSSVTAVTSTVGNLSASMSSVATSVNNLGSSITALTSTVNNLATSVGAIVSSQWVSSGSTISYNSGYVGVGTANPARPLHIRNTLNALQLDRGDNDLPFVLLVRYPDTTYGTPVQTWKFGGDQTGSNDFHISDLGTAIGGNGTPRLSVKATTGYVGIGVSSPTRPLAVSGAAAIAAFYSAPSNHGYLEFYTDMSNPSTRTAYMGYPSSASSRVFNIRSEYASGAVQLSNNANYLRLDSNGKVGLGISAPVTSLDVSGGVRISMEAATCAVSYAGTLRYNAGNVEYCNGTTWSAFGVAGAGVTGFNGSTSSTQTLAFGTTGTTPSVSTVNGVHTFNIPLASAASVAAGLISNSDYQTFTNKLNATSAAIIAALGYTPVAPGSVYTWSKTVAINNAEAVGGQKVLVTFPAGSQNTEVKVFTVRTISDFATATVAKFNLTITQGGQVAYVTAPTLEDNISNFYWYFDSSTGVAYLRFAQTSNSYSYIIQTTSTLSATPTAVVDAGTPPAFATITPQYTLGSGLVGDFSISTSGTKRLTVTSGGAIGVGTVTPQALLHAYGNGNNSNGLLYLQSNSGSADGSIARVGPYSYLNADSPGSAYYNWGARYDGDANAWVRTYTAAPNYLPYMALGTTGRVVIGGATSSATTDLAPTLADKFTFDIVNGYLGVGISAPQAHVDIYSASPTLRIGNTGTNTGTNQILFTHAANSTASQKLAIFSQATGAWGQGNLMLASNINSDGSNVTAADARLTVTSTGLVGTSGNFGAGTTIPGDTIEAFGASAAVRINSGNNIGTATLRLSHTSAGQNANKVAILAPAAGSYGRSTGIYFAINSALDGTDATTADTKMVLLENGNFGIGVLAPGAKLQIAAGTSSTAPLKLTSGTLLTSAQAGAVEYDGTNLYITDGTNTRRTIATGSAAGGIDGASTINSTTYITMVPSNSVIVSSTVASTNSSTGALVVKGGLGVAGAANIAGQLNVSGTIQSSSYLGGAHLLYLNATGSSYANAIDAAAGGERGFVADMGGSYAWDLLKLKNVSGTQFTVTGGGYTGIGTANPDRRLHIVGDGTNYGDDVFIEATNFDSTGTLAQINLAKSRGSPSTARTTILAGDTMGALAFRGYNGSSFGYGGLIKSVAETNFNTSENADLRFQTTNAGVSADRMTISAYGNVAIGASASAISSSRLVVAGNNAATLISLASATIVLQNANTTSGALNTLMFSNYDGFANAAISTAQSVTGNFGNKLLLQTKSASGGSWNQNQIVLDPSGYTGMGTSAPTTFLALENNYNGDTLVSVTNNYGNSGTLTRSGYVMTNVGSGYSGYSAGMMLGGVSHPTMGNQLAIFANSAITSGIQIATSSGFVNFATGGVERMRLAQNGNFGIGTSTPLDKIHVDASTASTRIAISSGSIFATDGYGVSLESDTDDGISYINLHTASMGANRAEFNIRGGHGPTESAATRSIASFKTDTGRVGIGNQNPTAQLHIGSQEAAPGTTSSVTRVAIQPYGHTGGPWNFIARDVAADAFLDIRYGPSSDVMTFEDSGKIGIGTLAPTQKLHVSGTVQLDGDVYGGKYGGTRGIWRFSTADPNFGIFYTEASPDSISFSPQGGGSTTPTMVVYGSNVGIGVSQPTYQLQISTDSAAKPGTNTWTIASDMRLKDSRGPFTRSLDELLGLETIYFKYKKDNALGLPSDKEYVGIRAQDVQKVIPEAVTKDEKGFLHFTSDPVFWTVVNSIKELYHKWTSDSEVLHQKVQVLEEENKAMKEYLCQKDTGAPFCARKPASTD